MDNYITKVDFQVRILKNTENCAKRRVLCTGAALAVEKKHHPGLHGDSWPHSRHTDRRLGVPWGHVEFVQKTRGKGDW